ncbi:uncharacterized protein PV09_09167 [Verruconis gallopava]|uniref:Uncharacterized protein n=1 Tax=Verruconis gallopava TaxID=253628 RepID=A0A0D1YEI7_9PEZI|nr:uncharacterized protein PV09_09167 [Verruconis gallopava]KIV99136.1 hypothetical protein PV09_09167 [Verruconis gallopava]
MPVIYRVVRRDSSQAGALTPTMTNLVIAFVVLFAAIALLVGTLFVLRQIRRSTDEQERQMSEVLPCYSEKPSLRSSRLTINTSNLEKDSLRSGQSSPDVPEIRITFPEEIDESGKRKSGRVVIVKVGDHSIGLEPVTEQLPPYQQTESADGRFHSLDLDRMGGLKEKEYM